MPFTEEEIDYLQSQSLARLATVAPDGQPDVVPVGFDFDGTYLYISGSGDTLKTRKFRNVSGGNPKVALVIDDLASTSPRAPRFLRIYGSADVVERDGYAGSGPYLRIAPTVSWSWNLEGRPWTGGAAEFGPKLHRTEHRHPPETEATDRPAEGAAQNGSAKR
jgi:pyridoxamine 5'-phosphate oxidase family protein